MQLQRKFHFQHNFLGWVFTVQCDGQTGMYCILPSKHVLNNPLPLCHHHSHLLLALYVRVFFSLSTLLFLLLFLPNPFFLPSPLVLSTVIYRFPLRVNPPGWVFHQDIKECTISINIQLKEL